MARYDWHPRSGEALYYTSTSSIFFPGCIVLWYILVVLIYVFGIDFYLTRSYILYSEVEWYVSRSVDRRMTRSFEIILVFVPLRIK